MGAKFQVGDHVIDTLDDAYGVVLSVDTNLHGVRARWFDLVRRRPIHSEPVFALDQFIRPADLVDKAQMAEVLRVHL
jgi:heat shock protein HspQ